MTHNDNECPYKAIWIDNNRVKELESQITTLTNENRDLKFRLADEQDCHSHGDCNKMIKQLTNEKTELQEKLKQLEEEILDEKSITDTIQKLLDDKKKQLEQYKAVIDEIKELNEINKELLIEKTHYFRAIKEILAKLS